MRMSNSRKTVFYANKRHITSKLKYGKLIWPNKMSKSQANLITHFKV